MQKRRISSTANLGFNSCFCKTVTEGGTELDKLIWTTTKLPCDKTAKLIC